MDVLATVSTAIRLADEYPPSDDDRPRHELAVLDKIALDRHPVAVYLARLARGRALQPGEIRSLFAACEDDDRKKPAMAARDAAILALLYGSGLRRAEAVGLDVADYDREGGTLKVRGKGNKERLAHLGDASQAALEAWLLSRGWEAGALFVAINKGGKLGTRGMSGQAMLYIARRR